MTRVDEGIQKSGEIIFKVYAGARVDVMISLSKNGVLLGIDSFGSGVAYVLDYTLVADNNSDILISFALKSDVCPAAERIIEML